MARDSRFSYHRTPANLGLSGARNFGFQFAQGKYVINLDADDMLTPRALGTLAAALDTQPDLHIAYGSLDTMNEQGQERKRNPWPAGPFNWFGQMSHINQLHYAALMRRTVWERMGGYRERMWRAEDAEFWCRASSFGFRIGRVTEESTLVYRVRSNSKGQTEYRTYADRDGPWNAELPWHQGMSGPEGDKLLRQGSPLPQRDLIPFGAQGTPQDRRFWNAPHHAHPLVSVVIPVGPGHARLALDALECLVAQDFGDWEAVVVNDTGEAWDTIPGAPYARVVHTTGKCGAGHARNAGLAAARGEFVLWLDADDLLAPNALRLMLGAYAQGKASYIYSDWYAAAAPGKPVKRDYAPEYNAPAWFKRGQHAVTVLMATADARTLAFDEEMRGWEDWDYFVQCAVKGLCGQRVPEPLLTYRQFTGMRRERALHAAEELLAYLRARYLDYIEGAKEMSKCCGGNGAAIAAIKRARGLSIPDAPAGLTPAVPVPEGFVRMQFIGPQKAPVTYYANGHAYTGANNERHHFVDVHKNDVGRLEAMGVWRVARVTPPAPPPAPASMPIAPPAPVIVPPVEPEPVERLETVSVPFIQTEPMTPTPEAVATVALSTPEPVAVEPVKVKRTRKVKSR